MRQLIYILILFFMSYTITAQDSLYKLGPDSKRKGSRKDIKIFLQDGSNDLNNIFGDWWLSNLQMESSLKFKGYDYKFEKGTGGHNGKHGGSVFPDTMRWLWSDIIKK